VENFQLRARTLCSKGIGKTRSPFVVEMRAARTAEEDGDARGTAGKRKKKDCDVSQNLVRVVY